MKRIGSLGLAACLAVLPMTVSAGAPEGSWYFTPQGNVLWLDDGRAADDDGGMTLSFGRVLSTNWDGQINLYRSEHDRAGGSELTLEGVGLSVNRVFYRESRAQPYLTFGLGRTNATNDPGDEIETLTATYGAGVLVDLGRMRDAGKHLFQIRAELGARRSLSDDAAPKNAVDYVAGIGLQISWGGTP